MFEIVLRNLSLGKTLVRRSIRVRKSMDDICHTLEAELAYHERENIAPHHKIELRVMSNSLAGESQGRRVTTVLLDTCSVRFTPAAHTVTISGRSPARDIIDSAWEGKLEKMTLKEICREIAFKQFGIKISTFPPDGPDPAKLIEAFEWTNESPWTKLAGEAMTQGFVFNSAEDGSLYLWQVPGEKNIRPGFAVTEGINVKSAEWLADRSNQFYTYKVTGGGHEPKILDDPYSVINKGRILTIGMTDEQVTEETMLGRAAAEFRRRRENSVTVTLKGWGLTDKQIQALGVTQGKEIFWTPNIMVPVHLPSLGVREQNLLVCEVTQEATAKSIYSEVTLCRREKYLEETPVELLRQL